MHRFTPICTIFLLLLAITNPSSTIAYETSSLRTPLLRILQDDTNSTNSTNATTPEDVPAGINVTAPTVAPQQAPDIAPAPVPTPAAPTTHEPTKKYEPRSDDEEEEEEEEKSALAKGVWIAVASILILGMVCYFRDAITFFVGSVSNNS